MKKLDLFCQYLMHEILLWKLSFNVFLILYVEQHLLVIPLSVHLLITCISLLPKHRG